MSKLFEELSPRQILDLIHNPQHVIGVWWYEIKNRELKYFNANEVKGHDDKQFDEFLKNSSKRYLEKGRVFKYNNKIVLLVYSTGFGKTTLNGDELLTLLNKIEKILGQDVSEVINDRGENLLERKIVERLLKHFNG